MVDLGAPGTAAAGFDEMQIGETEPVQRADRMVVERHRIRLAATVGDPVGRQPHRDAVGAPDADGGIHDLKQQPGTVGDRSAISVGAQIAVGLQELFEQIAVGAVDLDAVEAGLHRIARALPERFDHIGDFFRLQCTRRLVTLRLSGGGRRQHAGSSDRHCRRRNRQHAARLQRGMRHPADMPQLQKNESALGMNGVGDLSPAFDLLIRIDAGGGRISAPGRRHRRGFGDDQAARRGALPVIFRVQGPRRKTGSLRPHPRQRRHHDAVLQKTGPDLQRRKQGTAHDIPSVLLDE